MVEAKTVFRHVRYIDLDQAKSLSDEEVWKFIRSTWFSSSPNQTETLRRSSQVPPIRKKPGFDEVTFVDHHARQKDNSHHDHTTMCDFEIVHHIEAVMAGDGTSSAGYAFVLWPDVKRCQDFAKKVSIQERKHLEIVSLGGAQDKFRDAVAASEVAFIEVTHGARQAGFEGKKEETEKIRRVRLAPKEYREMAKQELLEATDILGNRNLDLLQCGLVEMKRTMPDHVIPCCNTGCNLRRTVKEVEAHMRTDCQGRLVKCEAGCGKLVKVCYKQHHEEIENQVEACL